MYILSWSLLPIPSPNPKGSAVTPFVVLVRLDTVLLEEITV